MRKIYPGRIRSKVSVEGGFIFYKVYVDNMLYILHIVRDSGFISLLDATDLDIFTGYSRYARVFNSWNGLPEVKEQYSVVEIAEGEIL